MRDIAKRLTVARLEIRHRMEGKYQLGLVEPGTWPLAESTLTLTEEDMIRFDHASLEMEAAVGEEQGEKENSA